jgi:hypothetical protein
VKRTVPASCQLSKDEADGGWERRAIGDRSSGRSAKSGAAAGYLFPVGRLYGPRSR